MSTVVDISVLRVRVISDVRFALKSNQTSYDSNKRFIMDCSKVVSHFGIWLHSFPSANVHIPINSYALDLFLCACVHVQEILKVVGGMEN